MGDETSPPQDAFPELLDWHPAGMRDAVFRARSAGGDSVYVRGGDGSAPLLIRLARESDLPAPRVLDHRDGWLALEALPGVPMHEARWRERPEDAVQIIADALLRLDRNAIKHGDMCLPNILGDLASGQLSGRVARLLSPASPDHRSAVASALLANGVASFASHSLEMRAR